MKTMYVYILKCSDDTFYTGVTNNLERRVTEHNSGISEESYTKSRRPLKLVFYVALNDPILQLHMRKKSKNGANLKNKLWLIQNLNPFLNSQKRTLNKTYH